MKHQNICIVRLFNFDLTNEFIENRYVNQKKKSQKNLTVKYHH